MHLLKLINSIHMKKKIVRRLEIGGGLKCKHETMTTLLSYVNVFNPIHNLKSW